MILDWGVPVVASLLGAGACRVAIVVLRRRAPMHLMRENVDGRPVPAVLGWAVIAGGILGLAFVTAFGVATSALSDVTLGFESIVRIAGSTWIHPAVVGGVLLLLSGFFLAGYWDDQQGNERPRGFRGHLAALRGGAVTGGMVKLIGGSMVALATMVLLAGASRPFIRIVLMAMVVALTANLGNLLDRAPGRVLKVFLGIILPLAAFGDPLFRTVAAGTIGAALAAFPADVKGVMMLGDAGANPLGALLGLGLAVHLAGSVPGLVLLVFALLALNLASERWSFSRVIAGNRWLDRLDHLGRD